MPIRWFAVGLASAILLIALHMESAQAARTAYTSLRVHCLKQVGAYRGADGRWRFYGARNSAQWQNFYNCLDANTMNRR